MPRYKAEVICRILAFHDTVVEADSPEDALQVAIAECKKLPKYDWDLEEVELDTVELNTYGPPQEVADD